MRIALATGLAVAGGLSLTGVLTSLPVKTGGEERHLATPRSETPQASASIRIARLDEDTERVQSALGAGAEAAAGGSHDGTAAAPPPHEVRLQARRRPSSLVEGALRAEALGDIATAAGPPQRQADPLARPAEHEAGLHRVLGRHPGAEPFLASSLVEPIPTGRGRGEATLEFAPTPEPETAAASARHEAPAAPLAEASGPLRYVVIGSFESERSAERHIADFARWRPQVRPNHKGDQVRYRVIVGPFSAADLPQALRQITQGGVPDAWQITLPQPPGAATLTLRRPDSLG